MCRVGEEGGLRMSDPWILRKSTCRLRRARDVHEVALFGRYYPLVALYCTCVAIIMKNMWVQVLDTIRF